ncbi:unnamed protein product [Discula destructiva]
MGEVASPNPVLRHRATQDGAGSGSASGSGSGSSVDSSLFPPAKWAFHKHGAPQTIAHRGYKASFPENTMGAFRGAVEVGAHAIETDVHLTKDDVVVIAHDKDLKRCYGEDRLVRDCDWSFLRTLRTLREPRQPMPRLADLLAYLAEPAQSAVWLLLDIKIDDPAETMLPLLAATIRAAAAAAAANNAGHWQHRIVLGCWTARHVALCHAHLPGFAVAWIGVTLPLAREYLAVPNVALNMRQEPLFGVGGRRFMEEVRADGTRPLFAWTVNSVAWMRWAIGVRLDAVITDDPKLFLEVCEGAKGSGESDASAVGVRGYLYSLVIPVLVKLLTSTFGYYKRVGGPEETRAILRKL